MTEPASICIGRDIVDGMEGPTMVRAGLGVEVSVNDGTWVSEAMVEPGDVITWRTKRSVSK